VKYTKDRIAGTIQKIKEFRALQEDIQDEAKDFGSYCTEYAKSSLSPFSVRVYDVCGMRGKDAKILVSTTFRSFSGRYFHYIGEGRFVWSKEISDKLYEFDICQGDHPYDAVALLERCENITKDLGVPCELIKSTLESRCSTAISNFRDALSRHPGGVLLGWGMITYHGWDCEDRWAVIEDSDGKHLYYGNTAHGGGMNCYVPPQGDYAEFLYMLSSETTVVSGPAASLLGLDLI
jgi:hypothetical protein